MRNRSEPAEMPCNELVELVSEYIEGRLPNADAERFEAHLEICEGCRNYLDQMRETIDTLGQLPEESLEPEARDRLLEAFRGWRDGTGP